MHFKTFLLVPMNCFSGN